MDLNINKSDGNATDLKPEHEGYKEAMAKKTKIEPKEKPEVESDDE